VADAAQRLAALATGMGGGALVDFIAAQPAAGGSTRSGTEERMFEYELQELAEQVIEEGRKGLRWGGGCCTCSTCWL
jgi:hypothetical protein